MRIWLLHIGEHLPVDGATRLFRYGYLANAFQAAGHEVLRWAPTYSHIDKAHRFSEDCRVAINSRYAIQFVHSPGYRRNAGWERLRTYHVLGRRFRELATRQEQPDLIVAAIPSLEWADAAVDYGRTNQVPVVIDIRDLWPDVFLTALPMAIRRVGRYMLAPYYRLARRACSRANGLVGVSQSYLDWGLELAGRSRGPHDAVVPLGFEPHPTPDALLQDNVAKLRARGIDPRRPICMFAGLFERSYDVETVVRAARQLRASGREDVQFVLCGDGAKMPKMRRLAEGLPNVHLLGWVDLTMVQAVASIAEIGLCAYADGAMQSLPNKPFEYMAGRLAICSSLPGELTDLLHRHQCGTTYRAGDCRSMAGCLSTMLAAPDQLSRMRSAAYRVWSEKYRSQEIYARFVDQLTKLPTPTRAAA